MSDFSFAGFDSVVNNMNKLISELPARTMAGLIKAAIELRADMDRTAPVIPVDTNNLRASWSTNPFYITPDQPAITCGFTARYAAYVHEMIGANFKRPGAGAHFFSAAIKRNEQRILQILKQESGIS